MARPVVIGIDPRNRDFSVDRLLAALAEVEAAAGRAPVLVYLDCDADHAAAPLQRDPAAASAEPARDRRSVGIEREVALLAPLRARADVLIDTRRDDAARAARRDGAAVRRGGGRAAGWR